jgi:hypothetical protein
MLEDLAGRLDQGVDCVGVGGVDLHGLRSEELAKFLLDLRETCFDDRL